MSLVPPTRRYAYATDGAAIYAESFATIRAEADLSAVPADAEKVAVRMIHACGQTDLATDLVIHPDLVRAARTALEAGAPILTDARMVAEGVTRARLPRDNEVRCYLRDERVPDLARAWGTTRSAAAVSLWAERLEGAVVAIGNAPTPCSTCWRCSATVPASGRDHRHTVGFVGAAESKQALVDLATDEPGLEVPYLVVRGRRGGSAMAASALNALAQEEE